VTRVMEVVAMTFPTKFVPVPRVAELPTTQRTPHECPPLIINTSELEAVVNVEPMIKTHLAFAFPCAFNVSVPVSCAEEP